MRLIPRRLALPSQQDEQSAITEPPALAQSGQATGNQRIFVSYLEFDSRDIGAEFTHGLDRDALSRLTSGPTTCRNLK
jgi:hypothetical protein